MTKPIINFNEPNDLPSFTYHRATNSMHNHSLSSGHSKMKQPGSSNGSTTRSNYGNPNGQSQGSNAGCNGQSQGKSHQQSNGQSSGPFNGQSQSAPSGGTSMASAEAQSNQSYGQSHGTTMGRSNVGKSGSTNGQTPGNSIGPKQGPTNVQSTSQSSANHSPSHGSPTNHAQGQSQSAPHQSANHNPASSSFGQTGSQMGKKIGQAMRAMANAMSRHQKPKAPHINVAKLAQQLIAQDDTTLLAILYQKLLMAKNYPAEYNRRIPFIDDTQLLINYSQLVAEMMYNHDDTDELTLADLCRVSGKEYWRINGNIISNPFGPLKQNEQIIVQLRNQFGRPKG